MEWRDSPKGMEFRARSFRNHLGRNGGEVEARTHLGPQWRQTHHREAEDATVTGVVRGTIGSGRSRIVMLGGGMLRPCVGAVTTVVMGAGRLAVRRRCSGLTMVGTISKPLGFSSAPEKEEDDTDKGDDRAAEPRNQHQFSRCSVVQVNLIRYSCRLWNLSMAALTHSLLRQRTWSSRRER